VGVTFILNTRLSFLDCLLVLLEDLFILLEELASGLGVKAGSIEPEVIEV
jgi:hypothetical protein